MEYQPLPRSFFARSTDVVARALVGCVVTHREGATTRRARIVETEAYLGPHDLACHTSKGRTVRNAVMWGPPGHAYVFLIYGVHWCFNVVTGKEGGGAAVLVRAGEAIEGCDGHLSGPGAFARGLHVGRAAYGVDLTHEQLFISARPPGRVRVVVGPRVNVDYAGAWASRPLRFVMRGNRCVSRPRPPGWAPPEPKL